MDVLLLHLLAKGPRHGYELMSDIQALAGAQYTPSSGALYPVLHKLAENGVVTVKTQVGARRHIYELSSSGKEKLRAESSTVERVLTRMSAFTPAPSGNTGDRIRQGLKELGSAVAENADRIPQTSEVQIISKLSYITRLLQRLGKKPPV